MLGIPISKYTKAQSAMEYLMTYGWAILIVAIVLAALFSLGVFSSGALIGTTCIASPGFLCSVPIVQGTTFTATLGQSTGSTWTNTVFCFVPNGSPSPSSCSGYPSSTANTLLSGQTETHSFTIDSSSSSDSGSIWAQYSTDGYSGLMSELAIVTIKGLTATPSSSSSSSSSFALPSGVTYYANVVITNSQSTATPAPFQQEVQIPESDYSNYISYNGVSANFEFFYNGGSVIPAWIESNSSGTLTVWLNLANGIPASNSITVYIGFAPETTNLLSSSGTSGIGEAPQLSPSYAEYDDGASVFNFYDNFAGTSLNTNKWTSGTSSGGTITVNNGITLTYSSSSSGGAWIASTYTLTQSDNVIWETNFNMYGTSNFNDVRSRFYFWENGQTGIADNNAYSWLKLVSNIDYGYFTDSDIGANIADAMLPYQTILGVLPTPLSATDYNTLSQEILNSNGLTFNTYSFPSYSSIGSGSQSGSNSDTFQLLIQSSDDGSSGNTNQINIAWTRVRAYPPDGVMPSVTLGPVVA